MYINMVIVCLCKTVDLAYKIRADTMKGARLSEIFMYMIVETQDSLSTII